jgi:SAM-dependent methyltransferase
MSKSQDSTEFAFRKTPPDRQHLARAAQGSTDRNSQVVALDIQCKYQFVDSNGAIFHEYEIPGNTDIHNCGGYVDKVLKYRDPSLRAHFDAKGVCQAALHDPAFSILATRSPQLDLLVVQLIQHIRTRENQSRLRLLDLGCTVAEHYDLIDTMLQSSSGRAARDVISYYGLDRSQLVLTAARVLHADIPREHFQLVLAEGSELSVPDKTFDLSLTVGVVNHVADPPRALRQLLRATRHAAVMALWVTSEPAGFWAINHSGNGNFFFSLDDLAALQQEFPEGRFLVADFIPESDSSQPRSYLGIDEARELSLGCYHLVWTTLRDVPFHFSPLVFQG